MHVRLGRIRLVLPASAIVQLHPVVIPIFNLPRVLESLGEKVPQVVVVRRVLEAKVADVC